MLKGKYLAIIKGETFSSSTLHNFPQQAEPKHSLISMKSFFVRNYYKQWDNLYLALSIYICIVSACTHVGAMSVSQSVVS